MKYLLSLQIETRLTSRKGGFPSQLLFFLDASMPSGTEFGTATDCHLRLPRIWNSQGLPPPPALWERVLTESPKPRLPPITCEVSCFVCGVLLAGLDRPWLPKKWGQIPATISECPIFRKRVLIPFSRFAPGLHRAACYGFLACSLRSLSN